MEILSPASNLEHIESAINAKANAVYGGTKKWNARNKAINFSKNEYNYVIKKLHENGLKFFLTLNILMLDEEIKEVIQFLNTNTLPDAFIVTDIGLIEKLNKEFPNVPLHISTQFGIHNIDDINYIKSLNGKRGILARELTLDEIKSIRNNTDIELECFVWGSQCISFSGLCFFGTVINGGGGNRGKCMINCRDLYQTKNEKGHILYQPDMNAINLLDELKDIDCLKIEGRRRNPKEIYGIINDIKKNVKSNRDRGFIFGTDIEKNNNYEKINERIKPLCKSENLLDITNDDTFIKYIDDKPIEFTKNYKEENVYYVYSEIQKKYDLTKKNIMLELKIENNIIKEVLYVNASGTGNTFFYENTDDLMNFIPNDLNKIFISYTNINLYKIKYYRNKLNNYYISKNLLNTIKKYIINDCTIVQTNYKNNPNFKINSKLYVETDKIDIAKELIKNTNYKVIYNMKDVSQLLKIECIINELKDKVIYKLPLFNWKSLDLKDSLEKLENKEVMFTRLTQIYLTKNINLKKRYTDFTIYSWNKEAIKYLKNCNIEEFTGSFELSMEKNKEIFENNCFQILLAGKIPMVYSRNCFKKSLGCKNCNKNLLKNIENIDKNLQFEISCSEDYRSIYYKEPILNDISRFNNNGNINYRYITFDEDINDILNNIKIILNKNYFNNLKKEKYFKNSYECNILESRD